jgi:hypothetical protein
MGKRRFLKTLAGFGVSTTTLNWITKDALAQQTSDLKKDIPYVKAFRNTGDGNREPVYGSIPRDQWVRTEAAFNASRSLKQQLEKKTDVSNIVVATRDTDGERKLVVKYRTKKKSVPTDNGVETVTETPDISKTELETMLPSTVTGVVDTDQFTETLEDIPVLLEEETRIDQDHGGYDHKYDYQYRPVPSGSQFDHGTLSGRAQYQDGDQYWTLLATGHGLKDAAQNDDDLQQPNNGPKIGSHTTINYWREDSSDDVTDFGYFQPYSDIDVTDSIADDYGSYRPNPIGGIVSWDWIKNNMNSKTITKQGEHTGRTSGEIVDAENDRGQKVFWQQGNSKSGDSGGPHYTTIDGTRYFVGVHAWGVDVGSTEDDDGIRSGGNSGEKVENTANVWVY